MVDCSRLHGKPTKGHALRVHSYHYCLIPVVLRAANADAMAELDMSTLHTKSLFGPQVWPCDRPPARHAPGKRHPSDSLPR